MIEFICPSCSRKFTVPDAAAGRKAKCPCGQQVTVPQAMQVTADLPPSVAARVPMRTRRLLADAREMNSAFANFTSIHITPAAGEPTELYRVDYRLRGLAAGPRGEPTLREEHTAEIQLTADYPRLAPMCRMLTPVFHPNIDSSAICIGDHWTAGERLVDLVVRIGEMLAYQAYNIKSPLNAEAAMWADLNAGRLPIDPQNLRPAELDAQAETE
jgi:ubiquitin-protein ligase/DNA-directed RNA polymerase subunit RPC12/RpoP